MTKTGSPAGRASLPGRPAHSLVRQPHRLATNDGIRSENRGVASATCMVLAAACAALLNTEGTWWVMVRFLQVFAEDGDNSAAAPVAGRAQQPTASARGRNPFSLIPDYLYGTGSSGASSVCRITDGQIRYYLPPLLRHGWRHARWRRRCTVAQQYVAAPLYDDKPAILGTEDDERAPAHGGRILSVAQHVGDEACSCAYRYRHHLGLRHETMPRTGRRRRLKKLMKKKFYDGSDLPKGRFDTRD